MKKIEAIIRPSRLESIKSALSEGGVTGLTVSDVRGTSARTDTPRGTFRGEAYVIRMPQRIKLDMTVRDEDVNQVVEMLISHGHTGEPGDGMIFVMPITDAIRIRTGETGEIIL